MACSGDYRRGNCLDLGPSDGGFSIRWLTLRRGRSHAAAVDRRLFFVLTRLKTPFWLLCAAWRVNALTVFRYAQSKIVRLRVKRAESNTAQWQHSLLRSRVATCSKRNMLSL